MFCLFAIETANREAGQCTKILEENAKVESYLEEVEEQKLPVDSYEIDEGNLPGQAFDPKNIRFRVGDRVHCIMGD
jgi:hypothetical protein